MSKEDTSTLFNLIKKGDQKSFRRAFDLFYQPLLCTSVSIVKDINTAKDVVQDVFLQIWNNREKIVLTNNLESYLKKSVINRSITKIKSQKRFTDDQKLEHKMTLSPSASEVLISQDVEKIVEETLTNLPDRCRLIYSMKRIEGMRLKEIAIELGISPKTVENQLTKALRVLKDALQPYVEETRRE